MSTLTLRATTSRRTTAVVGLALAAVLGLSACGDGGSTVAAGDSGPSSSSEVAGDAAFNEQDVTFVTDMRPHHAQAVEMADMILAKNPRPQVKALAEKIKAAQQPEIAQLDAMLATFGVEAGSAAGHGGGHSGGHSGGGSKASGSGMGMMSQQDMQALEAATGAEADRLFLEGMLEHHTGAVQMATEEIAGGKFPEAVALATKIKADQQAEITQMQQLLAAA